MGCGLVARVGANQIPIISVIPSTLSIYKYGLRSYLVSTFAFAFTRISFLVGIWFTINDEVGFFSVGRTFAEVLPLIYGSIGSLVFSYVGSMKNHDNSIFFIEHVCRLSVIIFSLTAIFAAIVAPVGIPLIFGEYYANSYLIVWILLPGLIFNSLQRILENYLYGRSRQASLIIVHLSSILILQTSTTAKLSFC